MAEVPQDAKYWLFGFGPKMHALMAFIINLLGIAAMIVGLVSAATKNSIGLTATEWFLLSILFFLWGFSFWFSAYFGAKEGYTK